MDGDNIYAVIRGSAVSHSGRTNAYAVPAFKAQVNIVAEAIESANIDPIASISGSLWVNRRNDLFFLSILEVLIKIFSRSI